MAKRKRTKGQSTIYKILHIKLKIGQNELHWKPGVNTGTAEGLAVPAIHMTPVVLLWNDTNIIWQGNRIGHQYK